MVVAPPAAERELCGRLGDEVDQAAWWAGISMTSMSFLNLIPWTTFGNWFSPFNRRHVFAAALMSLNIMSLAVFADQRNKSDVEMDGSRTALPLNFPIDHRDGVIPNIADADLALRLLLLEIFPSFDRCFFHIPIRPGLAIYLDLETSTDVLLNHVHFI
jgi:hypothetical protein